MTIEPRGRVIGLDISGTFGGGMRGALVDGTGSLLAEQAQREGAPASAIGVAVPGLINEASGMVHRSPNLPLQNVPLGQILRDRLKMPAFLIHDASAGALAEYALGAGRPVSDMMMVVIGSGVGSA